MLAPIEQVAQSEARYNEPSIAKKPEPAVEPDLREIERAVEEAPVEAAPDAGPKRSISIHENLVKRKEMIAALGQEPVEFAFERAIGKNDSVYSNFCDLIILAKRKV